MVASRATVSTAGSSAEAGGSEVSTDASSVAAFATGAGSILVLARVAGGGGDGAAAVVA